MTLLISDVLSLAIIAGIIVVQVLEYRHDWVSKKLEEMEKCDD